MVSLFASPTLRRTSCKSENFHIGKRCVLGHVQLYAGCYTSGRELIAVWLDGASALCVLVLLNWNPVQEELVRVSVSETELDAEHERYVATTATAGNKSLEFLRSSMPDGNLTPAPAPIARVPTL